MITIQDIVGPAEPGSCQHEPEVMRGYEHGDGYAIPISCPALAGYNVKIVRPCIDGQKARVYLVFEARSGSHAAPIGSLALLEGGDHILAIAETHRRRGIASALVAEGIWHTRHVGDRDFCFVPALRYTEGGHAAFTRAAEMLVEWES